MHISKSKLRQLIREAIMDSNNNSVAKFFVTFRDVVKQWSATNQDSEWQDDIVSVQPIADELGVELFSQVYFIDNEFYGKELYKFVIDMFDSGFGNFPSVVGFETGFSAVIERQGHKFVITDEQGYGAIWTTRAGAQALLQLAAEAGFPV